MRICFLKNLKYLYLCSNKIKKIEFFEPLGNLQVLHLGVNNIEKINNLISLE
ncbi:MAG: leucine-rich repeat domain-containing protein [Promethearchaeota archaeon]